jgi:hypothetical protein
VLPPPAPPAHRQRASGRARACPVGAGCPAGDDPTREPQRARRVTGAQVGSVSLSRSKTVKLSHSTLERRWSAGRWPGEGVGVERDDGRMYLPSVTWNPHRPHLSSVGELNAVGRTRDWRSTATPARWGPSGPMAARVPTECPVMSPGSVRAQPPPGLRHRASPRTAHRRRAAAVTLSPGLRRSSGLRSPTLAPASAAARHRSRPAGSSRGHRTAGCTINDSWAI